MTGQARDRDPAGRPRNARPRDAFGRPLPRAVAGGTQLSSAPCSCRVGACTGARMRCA